MAAARATILSAAHVTRPSRAQDDPIVPSLDQAILKTTAQAAPALWHFGLFSYQERGTKLDRFFAKNRELQF